MSGIVEYVAGLPMFVQVGGAAIFLLVVLKNLDKIIMFFLRPRVKLAKNWTKDKVILHQVSRGYAAPSISPYPIKLETYLRMANIPYENDMTTGFSSKGKTPWMEYNGEAVADSQFCIEHLNRERNIDLNSHLTLEEQAVARAFRKLSEESLFWCLLMERWVYLPPAENISLFFPNLSTLKRFAIRYVFRPNMGKQAYAAGMGRHTKEEVYSIYRADLKALSTYLGKKKFLFGDRACETDCAVFAMLAQILWQERGTFANKLITGEFENLKDYSFRMKDTYWPDWDECITHADRKMKDD